MSTVTFDFINEVHHETSLKLQSNTKYLAATYKHILNAAINVKPVGGRRGIGRDFDIFQKIAVKFPTPGQKREVKYN